MTGSLAAGRDRSRISVEQVVRRFGPSLELLVHHPEGPAKAAPVLFLHGAFAGAWCWEESWLPWIGETGRFAAAFSLRGHGRSEGQDKVGWAGLADFHADLKLAIAAMPSPPVVVAHSFGGLLAQQLLAQVRMGSVAIRGLVLVGSLPPEGLSIIAPWLGVSTWLAAATGTAGFRRPSAFGDRFKRSGDGTWNAAAAAGHSLWAGEAAYVGLAQAMIPLPVLPAWIAGVPALVLHGEDDALIDAATAARTAAYHGAQYECVPEAGHFAMLGRHAAAGAEALCKWLDSRGI